MDATKDRIGEYYLKEAGWADGWAVVADPAKFAERFNLIVRGAYRPVTVDDIRSMMKCGLIGRCGFFDRSDLQTVRGILQYERLRERTAE
ncbi:MAG TPA: hypothetical protein G4O13_05145 [Dehalococcoidia bacterium]|nr:hypothetical protein [Dehalococcoidia bacterium]